MKTILFAVFFVITSACSAFADENPYIREKADDSGVKVPVVCSEEPFSYLPVDCWKNQRIIFMPMTDGLQQYGYQSISHSPQGSGYHLSYKEGVGRIGTITSIQDGFPWEKFFTVEITMTDNGQKYYYTSLLEYKNKGHMDNVVFLRDIDDSRKKYVGKRMWVYGKGVTIVDVVVSDTAWAPVRFIVKSDTGEEEPYDVRMSDTNKSIFGSQTFSDLFSSVDPKILEAQAAEARAKKYANFKKMLKEKYKKYKWSKKVWDSIFNKTAFIGMTKLQATLSWGEPESINRTSGTYGVHEQWVYGGNNYLYFENGLLKAIQN